MKKISFKIRLDATMEEFNKGQVSEQSVTNMQENSSQQQIVND